jgi:hypothetical protein
MYRLRTPAREIAQALLIVMRHGSLIPVLLTDCAFRLLV